MWESLPIPSSWKMPALAKKEGKRKKGAYAVLSFREELDCLLEGGMIAALFAYFFYRSLIAFFLLLPGIYWYRGWRKRMLVRRKQEKLTVQFKELLLAVSSHMQAGYSIENAFLNSEADMRQLFGPQSEIVGELQNIRRGLGNGIMLGELLLDLGRRSGEGEIREFAEVYGVARETGGRWNELMKKTVEMIRLKLEIKEEISLLVHAKKTENRIMSLIPFFILFYMNLTSPGYFDLLYHSAAGVLMMTACMCLYCGAFLLGERITDISL